jgi:hypothetical protein
MAIIQGAKRLGLDPYEFGAFLSLESGPNMDPNIVGGAGGRYKGMIQFGPNEQNIYGISGQQTRAGQMPKVLQFFEDRGYKPGMGIARAYATVLGGNPNVSLNAKDSFGTSVAGALPRFRKGGDLYENARRVLGDIPVGGPGAPAAPKPLKSQPQTPAPAAPTDLAGQRDPVLMQMAQQIVQPLLTPLLAPRSTPTSSSFGNFLNMFGSLIR